MGSTALQLVEKPEGDFIWENSGLPICVCGWCIGVTPFHSILKQRMHDGQPTKVTLVYGSRTPDVPFKKELEEWKAADPDLEVRYVSGKPLTADSLAEVPEINRCLVYLSGPEQMVEALGDDLKKHGLPESQLKQDFFPNYNENNY